MKNQISAREFALRELQHNSIRWRLACAMWIVVTFINSVYAADPTDHVSLRADSNYRAKATDPITYRVDFSAIVTAPYHTKLLQVWMPLPPSDNAQQISDRSLTTFPELIEPQIATESVYGNKFAYFEFHNPQGAQIIRHQFSATVSTLNWNVDPERVIAQDQWPVDFKPYLEQQQIADSPEFREVIQTISPITTTSASNLFRAMDWIDANLTYNHSDASLRADSSHAFNRRRGHCSDYHGLCATMGRTLGFPTRITYGLALFPKNSPSHCKLEAFLPPYGWVSFDLSETQKMIQTMSTDPSLQRQQKHALTAAARARLQRGFRENSWLLLTRGSDYELAPPGAERVSVVRTIYAQADGVALPEPDPANIEKREYGWMTAHRYTPSQAVIQPFKDYTTLMP